MALHRADRDHELLCDLAVAGPLGDQAQHFQLAKTEAFPEEGLCSLVPWLYLFLAGSGCHGDGIQDAGDGSLEHASLGGLAEQLGQGWSAIKNAQVSFRLRGGKGILQSGPGALSFARCAPAERLDD